MWQYHHFLPGFLANDQLPRVSRQSRLSANVEGDNEMIPMAVHTNHAFTLWLRKPQKTSARRQSDENCVTSYRLRLGPLPLNVVDRIVQHVMEGGGRKVGNDGYSKISEKEIADFGLFQIRISTKFTERTFHFSFMC